MYRHFVFRMFLFSYTSSTVGTDTCVRVHAKYRKTATFIGWILFCFREMFYSFFVLEHEAHLIAETVGIE